MGLPQYQYMVETVKQYPKLLAFLKLFYADLYANLSQHSSKADIVEANLICSNNPHSYQAMIFSEDVANDGELLQIYTGKDSIAPYAWDWRWVFAVKILFAEEIIFPISFKQKVIALPSGKHPLTEIFFNILQNEFKEALEQVVKQSIEKKTAINECYVKHCISVNI